MLSYALVLFVLFFTRIETKFAIPDLTIQVLNPKGITVSIPHTDGIQLFGFHANINQSIRTKELGTISREVESPENGKWSFTDENVSLKPGDILNYWVFVQHNRLGFDKQNQKYTVSGYVDKANENECLATATKINGGQSTCSGQLLFEDNFNGNDINEAKWSIEQFVPIVPDYEFNSFENRRQNCFTSAGYLQLKADVRENPYAPVLDLTIGCTQEKCTITNEGKLNPPVVSGKVKSKFSFKYGKIEIKAKLPVADWMYPQLHLEPKENSYGDGYRSGRMWIAYARGNKNLRTEQGEDISNNVLYMGPVLTNEEPARTSIATKVTLGSPWGDTYHTYTLTWKPDGISLSVDGTDKGTISGSTFANQKDSSSIPYKSTWKKTMSPFDQEFVLSLGLAVGGLSDFPDRCISNGRAKPWKNLSPKAPLQFLRSNDTWANSWGGDNSILKVDSVKVWAL